MLEKDHIDKILFSVYSDVLIGKVVEDCHITIFILFLPKYGVPLLETLLER